VSKFLPITALFKTTCPCCTWARFSTTRRCSDFKLSSQSRGWNKVCLLSRALDALAAHEACLARDAKQCTCTLVLRVADSWAWRTKPILQFTSHSDFGSFVTGTAWTGPNPPARRAYRGAIVSPTLVPQPSRRRQKFEGTKKRNIHLTRNARRELVPIDLSLACSA